MLPSTIPYYLETKLRELIVDNTFRPGQPLREQDLEKRFSASRGPIREALRLLEVRGLVTHIPRRGFRVKLYSDREIYDHYILRAELEAFAIAQLARHNDLSPLVADLERCHADLEKSFAAQDPSRYLENIRAFYRTIAQYAGNVPLCDVLEKLNETVEPLRYNLLSRKLGESRTLAYTRHIIDALAQRRFEEAGRLKREHVLANLPNVIAAYAQSRFPGASTASVP